MITIGADGHGEIAFGAMQAGLDLGYSPSMVIFTWARFDEMDEVNSDGSAEFLDDGSIEITFAYHNGDEAILKANRDPSSTACEWALEPSPTLTFALANTVAVLIIES